MTRPENQEYCQLYGDLIDSSSVNRFDTLSDTIYPEISDDEIISQIVTPQRTLWKRRMSQLQAQLMQDAGPSNATKAWITSCADRGCSSWFFSAVQSSPQLQITAEDYLENVRFCLGLPITEANSCMPLMCYCENTHLDDFNQEHHGLGCKQFPKTESDATTWCSISWYSF